MTGGHRQAAGSCTPSNHSMRVHVVAGQAHSIAVHRACCSAAVVEWRTSGGSGGGRYVFVGMCVQALMSNSLAGQGGKLVVSEFCSAAVI